MLPLAKRLVRFFRGRRRSQHWSSTETDRDDAVSATGRAHLAAIAEDYGHFPARTSGSETARSGPVPLHRSPPR
jgi:hypothetical protein